MISEQPAQVIGDWSLMQHSVTNLSIKGKISARSPKSDPNKISRFPTDSNTTNPSTRQAFSAPIIPVP